MPKQKISQRKTTVRVKRTYCRHEAMELLGLKTVNFLLRLERLYPDAFVVVKRDAKGKVLYDKVLLDRFAGWRKLFEKEKV